MVSSPATDIFASKIQFNYVKVSVNPLGFVNWQVSYIKWTIFGRIQAHWGKKIFLRII